ncbi:MAG: hypothetical protein ACI4EN_07215 [Butyrivibrio sp.]
MADIYVSKNNMTNILSAELIYVFNRKVRTIAMEYCLTGWRISLDLPDGEYLYKFVFNDGIRMNDPEAYCYREWINGEVWSLLNIKDGKAVSRRYDAVNIRNVIVHSKSGKLLQYPGDRRCYADFEINNVKGIHSLTILWYQPDGSLYHIEETTVRASGTGFSSFAETMWVELDMKSHSFDLGTWMVEVYADGIRQVREFFNVTDTRTVERVNVISLGI